MRKIALGMAFSLVTFLAACGPNLTDVEHVERARNFLDKGDLNGAVVELKNALGLNGQNAEARWLLGSIHLEAGDAAGAEKEFRYALELGVSADTILPELAAALIAQQKFDELQRLPLIEMSAAPSKARVLAMKSMANAFQGNYQRAKEQYTQAVSLDPDNLYVCLAKGRYQAEQKEYDQARKQLEHCLSLDGEFAPAWGLLGDISKLQQDFAEAEKAYTKAIDNAHANTVYRLNRAYVRAKLGALEKAQQDVDVLMRVAPQNAELNFVQGLIDFERKRYKEASAAFEVALKTDPNHLEANFLSAMSHLFLGNGELAEEYARTTFKLAPNSVGARKLLAFVELSKGDHARVIELLEPVVSVYDKDPVAAKMLARAYYRSDRKEQALNLLRKVVKLEPESPAERVRLGEALLGAGHIEEGMKNIQDALKMDAGLEQAHVVLVNYFLQQKDLKSALGEAEKYVEQFPKSGQSHLLLGLVLLGSQQMAAGIDELEKSLELTPGNVLAARALASSAVGEKDYQRAKAILEKALVSNPDNLELLMNLAFVEGLRGEKDQMVARLKQAMESHPRALEPRAALARYYMIGGNVTNIPSLLVGLNNRQLNTPEILEPLAFSYLARRRFADAKVTLRALVEQRPESVPGRFMLARAFVGLGEIDKAAVQLQKVVELNPDNLIARIMLARVLLAQGKERQSEEQIAALEHRAPKHPDVLELKALLSGHKGRAEEASQLLKEAFEAAPSKRYLLDVIKAEVATGKVDEAHAVIDRWLAEHPEDTEASVISGVIYSLQNNIDRAIEENRKIISRDARNVDALNNLAWELRKRDPKKALEYARRVNTIAPEYVPGIDTLAMVLLDAGKIENAQAKIEYALHMAPQDPMLKYHAAVISSAAGDDRKAREILQKLLEENKAFPARKEAEQMLSRLQGGGTE